MFRPVSNQHSITRVIANLFLAQNIVKPKDIFDKLVEGNLLSNYQKKGLGRSKKINIGNTGTDVKISDDQIIGFIFEEFNASGQSINSLKVENIPDRNKGRIVLETTAYDRWRDFIEKFSTDLEIINGVLNFYTEAISLNYIDEFVWEGEGKMPIEEIFDTASELLNSTFTESHNGTILIMTQSEPKQGVKVFEDKTEIVFNNDFNNVIINHTFGIKLEDFKLLDNSIFELYHFAHGKNKDLLNKILKESIKEQIKLT